MIRKPTKEDISRLAEIHIYGWRFAYKNILSEIELYKNRQVAKAMNMHRKKINENIESIDVYDDGILKGFVLHNDSRDSDIPEAYELSAIYIEPAFIGQGIGSKLLSYIEQKCIDMKKKQLIIWVLKDNKIGINFYIKHGYCFDGSTKTIDKWKVLEQRYKKILVL